MPNKKNLILRKMQRHTQVCLCIVLSIWVMTGCQRTEEVRFHRLEQLLFTTPADRLASELKKHRAEYDTELIVMNPDDADFIRMTQEYTSDPTMREVYRITDSLYHDMSEVETELGKALGRAYSLYPQMHHIERCYTMVTGDFDNYMFRVYSNGSDLCLSIDQYALGYMGKYSYFGMPQHIVRFCTREHIAADCMGCLAQMNIAWPDGEHTLLDYAIAEGKKLYFMEKTLPHRHDTILLRYTKEQYDWMQKNTENVWSWMIQNKMLYNTDYSSFRNLIDDAPKTNAFGDGSAPRATSYIGWQIVKAFMKKSGATMQQLFDESDSQTILKKSGWRP